MWIAVWVIAALAILTLAASYICFYMTFYVAKREEYEEYPIPEGEVYEPYREQMIEWMKEIREMPRQRVEIKSRDGLRLTGYYYEYKKGAPIEILFHGYRGSAERDLCGGVERCFSLGRSALIVDQRCAGNSEGKVISFGIKESDDCVDWVNFVVGHIDPNAKIIIGGISMGASTVLMASVKDMPENVVGVLADCGFTSAKAIIKKVVRNMKLPADLLYPLVRLGAIIFGRFDPDGDSPVEAVKKSRLPIIFFHGESDDFVPSSMSKENYDACASEKKLVTVAGAGHGLAFLVDPEKYLFEVREFFEPILK